MKKVTLVLAADHIDAGKPYKAGERIEVDALTANWMVGNGIAKAVPAARQGKSINQPVKEKDNG